MRRRGALDWPALAGIGFVCLSILDLGVLANSLDSHRSKAEFAAYYHGFRGSSHEWRELLATAVAILAAFCFAWFVRRLRDAVAPVDQGLAGLVLGGGLLFVGLWLTALVASTAVGTTLAYSDDYRVDLDTAILMSNVALFLYTAATGGAAVMVWAVSLAAARGRLLPTWLVRAGFVVAIACLTTTALDGLSLILLAAWLLTLSILPERPAQPSELLAQAGPS